MGEYVFNSPMLSIPMGGVDVVLGVQWLQSLGTVAFNFQELFLNFYFYFYFLFIFYYYYFFFRRKGSRIMGYCKEAKKDNKI